MTDEGALHVMGLKQDYSGDDYANSYHILGRSASDFILEFLPLPKRRKRNGIRLAFPSAARVMKTNGTSIWC